MAVSSDCGLFSWRPKFLEIFNKPWVFLTLFSISSFGMAVPIGMNQIILPLLQSLFNLSTQQMGWILVSNDLSGIFFSLVIGQVCSSQKTRWLAVGIIITFLSGIIQSIPHFFAELPPIIRNENITASKDKIVVDQMCSYNTTHYDSIDASTDVKFYAVSNNKLYWVLILGGIVQGIGHTPPGIAGMTYLDEIYSEKKIGLAIGTVLVVTCVGFPMALVIGAAFLKIYATLSTPDGLQLSDPEWVGAWWLGYIVPGLIVLVTGIPILLFPQQPSYAIKVLKKKSKAGATNEAEKELEMKRSLKVLILDFIPSLKRLFINKSLMFFILGDAMLFLFFASTPYEPKLVSIYYRMDPVRVGYIVGMSRVVATIVGLAAGSFLTSSQRFTGELGRRCIKVVSIASFVTIPLGFISLYYCKQDTIAGLTAPYPSFKPKFENKMNLSLECNSNCNCETSFYTPVCDRNSTTTYFSPCMIGCTRQLEAVNEQVKRRYGNCECLGTDVTVDEGSCNPVGTPQCERKFWIYVVVTGVGAAGLFLIIPAVNIVYLRITNEIDRSAAQGLKQFVTRFMGTLPGPLLFGALIDSYCILWRNTDNSRGSCLVYDTYSLQLVYTFGQFGVHLAASVCFFCSLYFYPSTKSYSRVQTTNSEPAM